MIQATPVGNTFSDDGVIASFRSLTLLIPFKEERKPGWQDLLTISDCHTALLTTHRSLINVISTTTLYFKLKPRLSCSHYKFYDVHIYCPMEKLFLNSYIIRFLLLKEIYTQLKSNYISHLIIVWIVVENQLKNFK